MTPSMTRPEQGQEAERSSPRPGDLWRDSYPRGGRCPRPYEMWFAVSTPGDVQLVDSFGRQEEVGYVERAYGPLALMHRESAAAIDEPSPYERALIVLADKVADLEAASKRCDSGGRCSLAIEYRTESDAVRLALVGVIELDGVELDAAIVRAHELIAEAVRRRQPAPQSISPADIKQGVTYLDRNGYAWVWKGDTSMGPEDHPLLVSVDGALWLAVSVIDERGPLREAPNIADFAEITVVEAGEAVASDG